MFSETCRSIFKFISLAQLSTIIEVSFTLELKYYAQRNANGPRKSVARRLSNYDCLTTCCMSMKASASD
jgi:hypothetical protein